MKNVMTKSLYLQRKKLAEKNVAMRVARTHFGVDFYEELKLMAGNSWKYAIISEINKRDKERFEQGFKPLDMVFWDKLVEQYGTWQPYHPAFPAGFPLIIAKKPFPELEPFLTALAEGQVVEGIAELDEEFFRYMSEVLQEAIITSVGPAKSRLTRALEWCVNQQLLLKHPTITNESILSTDYTQSASALTYENKAADPPAPFIDDAESILVSGFSFEKADKIAMKIGLIKNGIFSLDKKKYAAIVGFYTALFRRKKLKGKAREFTRVFGKRYGVENMSTTRWHNTYIGRLYYDQTMFELKEVL
jgi:hypothetical protein